MKVRFSTILFFLAISSALVGAGDLPVSFVDKHCIECHDKDTEKGEFSAELLTKDLGDEENAKRWSRVLARVQSGEMPPPKEKNRPSAAEQIRALNELKSAFYQHAKEEYAEAGRVRTRRLNRLEYENTMHDLLGIDTLLQDLLPEDDLQEGFANNTEALSISPVHIQQYMAAADLALRNATERQKRPETKTYRFSYNHEKEKPFHGHAHNRLPCNLEGDELHFFLPTHIEVPAYLRQFEEVTRNQPGNYKIKVTTEARDTKENADLIYSVWMAAGNKRRELLGYFDARFRKSTTIEITHHFEPNQTIIIAPYRMAQARVEGGYGIYFPDKKEKIPEGWHFINNPNPPIATVGPALVVKPVEITGPLVESWPSSGHKLLFGDAELIPAAEAAKSARVPDSILRPRRGHRQLPDPLTVKPKSEEHDDGSKAVLAEFMSRAFRRPVEQDEVDLYYGLVRDRLDKGECYEVAMNAAQRAVLCSPDFLFMVESGPKLNAFELAVRLSYFLWRTTPDARLRDLAKRGELTKPDVLRKEVDRLLASPRSEAFVNDFLDHWLNLREINATTPDKDLFPEYFVNYGSGVQDILLHNSIMEESRMYFRDLVQRDLGVEFLVKSPHTYLNQRLAAHYGLPPVKGTQLRRVNLPKDSVRGGFLTQASVLKVTANGANTSPVIRGVWLLERVLGTPAPAPPPDAGSIEPDTRGATTIREQLAKHMSSSSCAGCHQKIDPPGFVLESFDPVGQYRDFYRTTETGEKLNDTKVWLGGNYSRVKYLKGADVDSSCIMPDETEVPDIRAYKDVLAGQPELIARNFTNKLVTYATGVHTEPGDAMVVDQILNKAKPKNYGLKSLIHEIVQSELFLTK